MPIRCCRLGWVEPSPSQRVRALPTAMRGGSAAAEPSRRQTNGRSATVNGSAVFIGRRSARAPPAGARQPLAARAVLGGGAGRGEVIAAISPTRDSLGNRVAALRPAAPHGIRPVKGSGSCPTREAAPWVQPKRKERWSHDPNLQPVPASGPAVDKAIWLWPLAKPSHTSASKAAKGNTMTKEGKRAYLWAFSASSVQRDTKPRLQAGTLG